MNSNTIVWRAILVFTLDTMMQQDKTIHRQHSANNHTQNIPVIFIYPEML